jgi:hypothetical protein
MIIRQNMPPDTIKALFDIEIHANVAGLRRLESA